MISDTGDIIMLKKMIMIINDKELIKKDNNKERVSIMRTENLITVMIQITSMIAAKTTTTALVKTTNIHQVFKHILPIS